MSSHNETTWGVFDFNGLTQKYKQKFQNSLFLFLYYVVFHFSQLKNICEITLMKLVCSCSCPLLIFLFHLPYLGQIKWLVSFIKAKSQTILKFFFFTVFLFFFYVVLHFNCCQLINICRMKFKLLGLGRQNVFFLVHDHISLICKDHERAN